MPSFPKQHRADTMELPVAAAISAVTAGLLWPSSQPIAIIIAIPAIIVGLYWLAVGVANTIRRVRWMTSGSSDYM